jgi:hypothetical protein
MQVSTAAGLLLSAVVAASGVTACTVSAPPAEDLSGEALIVNDGRLQIDSDKVPVLAEPCVEGQTVVRTAEGWACAPIGVAGSVTAGDGLTGGGAGDVTLEVDFGDDDSQVASGARALALETALETATTTAATALSDVDGRVEVLEQQSLTDLYVSTCDTAAIGGLGFVNGSLVMCDGVDFRAVQLAAPPPPAIIADYDVASRSGNAWTDKTGGDAIALGTDMGVVNIAGPPVRSGIGRLVGGGAGFGAPVGQRLLELPARGFSIEIVAQGSDQFFVHGADGLSLQVFGSEVSVREFGREMRFQIVNAIESTSPNHFVYVHKDNNDRDLFVNGERLLQAPDAGRWTGPYLGERGVFTLGSRFAAGAGGGPIFLKVVIHGQPLNAVAVTAACEAAEAANIINAICR